MAKNDRNQERVQVVRPRAGAQRLLVNINKGDVVVVCGPSGSGKSTLIKTVNALEPIQKGEITVDGIRSATPRPTCPSCAAAWAWCSSTSSCSRT
jgi:ABC-type polar amino acid transport system ATPase subunit